MQVADTQKKILFINTSPWKGGAEISMLECLQRLDAQQFNCLVTLPAPGSLHREVAALARTCIVPMPLYGLLKACFLMRKIIYREKIQLIYCNTTHAAVYGALLRLLTGKKMIWHVRDNIKLPLPASLLAMSASRIVCNSHYTAAQVPFFKKKTSVIYNIVAAIENSHRPSANIPPVDDKRPSGIYIVQAGRLLPWKNHTDAILAIKACAARFPHIRLLIAGDDTGGHYPEYKKQLQELVQKNGLQKKVVFVGENNQLPRLLQKAHLLLHPAHNEPFGRVIIEAMSAGIPVVACAAGGPAEIIQHGITGLLSPCAAGWQGLADNISLLLAQPLLQQEMGLRAKAYIQNCYDNKALIRQYESILSGA
jgi:L-malate glycosyltransferase